MNVCARSEVRGKMLFSCFSTFYVWMMNYDCPSTIRARLTLLTEMFKWTRDGWLDGGRRDATSRSFRRRSIAVFSWNTVKSWLGTLLSEGQVSGTYWVFWTRLERTFNSHWARWQLQSWRHVPHSTLHFMTHNEFFFLFTYTEQISNLILDFDEAL